MTSFPDAPATPQLTGRSAYVEIDAGAIAGNVGALRERSGSAEVMAVVKADGYGHGLVTAARAAQAGGAAWLGVAQLTEALDLRAAGVAGPVLTWLYVPGADFGAAISADIDITVSSTWALDAVCAAARMRGRPARVQIKVDTGLSRNGAVGQGWDDLLTATARAVADGAIELIGVWSHFVYADQPEHPTVLAQHERFDQALVEVERAGLRPQLRHLANSAATLTNPAVHYDLVRPGVAVYGLSPVPQIGSPADFGLREAMRVIGSLALVKRVPAGTGVSYGHQYTTDRETVLGLVPLGYADGVPRNATNVGPVLVGGQRGSVTGRVCMDQFVVDLGPDFVGAAGDPVVLFGRGADGEPTAQDWAAATDTINYELVTRVSSRLPRVVVGADQR